MPRFHAALGMLSPAKTKIVEAIKNNNPANTKRAESFTESSDYSIPDFARKTIFYIDKLEYKFDDGNVAEFANNEI
jgi:hypothetical protein